MARVWDEEYGAPTASDTTLLYQCLGQREGGGLSSMTASVIGAQLGHTGYVQPAEATTMLSNVC